MCPPPSTCEPPLPLAPVGAVPSFEAFAVVLQQRHTQLGLSVPATRYREMPWAFRVLLRYRGGTPFELSHCVLCTQPIRHMYHADTYETLPLGP